MVFTPAFFFFGCCLQVAALLRRIEALEKQKPGDIDTGLKSLAAYGLRREADFDKYLALSMVKDLVTSARAANHKETSFLSAAARAF